MAKKKIKITKKFTNLILIDASGSMGGKALEVIGGIKKLFNDIKADAEKNPEVETTTIVVDFSGTRDFNVLINSKETKDLLDSVANAYTTRGMTALYDAIGFSFNLIPKDQDGVFVNIITDGEENDSKELKAGDVKKLIEDGKSKKWAITFMGTTENCLNHAVSLGVSPGNTMQFMDNNLGQKKAMKTTTLSRTVYYNASVSGSADFENFDISNVVANVMSDEKE